jgi:hypothetical protein
MNTNSENVEKMSFKDYFNSLPTEESNAIRDKMLQSSGMSYPSFYGKIQSGKWKPLEIRELERITGKEFKQ